MRGVRNMFMSIIGTVLLSIAPAVYADYSDDAEYKDNGAIASALEGALRDYLMENEVQQFGFAIYQQGKSYGSDGSEYVSASPQLELVDKHIAGYCSPNIPAEKEGFGCVAKPVGDDAKYLEMGDVKFSVLLEPDKYSSLTDIMAQNLIRNVVTPFPPSKFADAVKSGDLKTDAEQKKKYAKYLANQATLGVALYSLNEMYGMRVSGNTLGVTEPADAETSSLMKVMEDGASRRFLQAEDFVAFLDDPSTDFLAVMKEVATMQAFSMWMEFQRFRQGERIEALLAANLSYQVRAIEDQAEMVSSASESTLQ